MKRFLVVFGGMMLPSFGTAGTALASDGAQVPFKITTNSRTRQNRLIIPKQFLAENAVLVTPKSHLRTIIAGIAISVSLAALAFLMIRKKSKAAQAMALCFALGGGGVFWIDQANADVPPPTADVAWKWDRIPDGQKNVIVEFTETGEAVELVMGTYRKWNPPPRFRSEPPRDRPEPPKKTPELKQ